MTGFKIYDARVQCDGKLPYTRKADVKRAIKLIERHSGRMFPYRCPHCGYWHMGHRPYTGPTS
jgi:hypothetical protein